MVMVVMLGGAALLPSCGRVDAVGMPDGGSPAVCGTRPTGDTLWPQYRLPGTPGGLPRSYELVGTETVMDCVTGLQWQRAADAWDLTREAAISYCDDLALGGHTDWRLPSTLELMTLLDYSVANPDIDATFFPSAPTGWFWTSSPYLEPGSGQAWLIYFGAGAVQNNGDTLSGVRARCVR